MLHGKRGGAGGLGRRGDALIFNMHRHEKCESSVGNFTTCATRVPYWQPVEVKKEIVKKKKNEVLVIAKPFLYSVMKRCLKACLWP